VEGPLQIEAELMFQPISYRWAANLEIVRCSGDEAVYVVLRCDVVQFGGEARRRASRSLNDRHISSVESCGRDAHTLPARPERQVDGCFGHARVGFHREPRQRCFVGCALAAAF
jgi:hypothetical protein